MIFRRSRGVAPSPDVMRRLTLSGDSRAQPSDKYLLENTQLLENLQAMIDIAFHRSKRQLEVLAFGGQRPDALELFRVELGSLQKLIEEVGTAEPPFSPIEVGRQLRAFATGTGEESNG